MAALSKPQHPDLRSSHGLTTGGARMTKLNLVNPALKYLTPSAPHSNFES